MARRWDARNRACSRTDPKARARLWEAAGTAHADTYTTHLGHGYFYAPPNPHACGRLAGPNHRYADAHPGSAGAKR